MVVVKERNSLRLAKKRRTDCGSPQVERIRWEEASQSDKSLENFADVFYGVDFIFNG